MKALTIVTACLAGLLVLVILSDCVTRVEAHPPPLAEDLARITVSESGFESPADMRGIWAVFVNTHVAKKVPLRALMRAYSSRAFDKTRQDRRQWIAHLGAAEAPTGWPEQAVPWKAVGLKRWRRVLELARKVVKEAPACAATHWGNSADWSKWEIPWVRVDCGSTLNVFGRPG